MSTPEESYRALVQQYLQNGELSADEREALEIDRMTLRLLPDQARAIEQEVLSQASSQANPIKQPTLVSTPVPIPAPIPIPVPEPNPTPPVSVPDQGWPSAQLPDSIRQPAPPQLTPAVFNPQGQLPAMGLHSADYQSNRERYKRLMRQAYEAKGMLTSEVRADLSKFAQELGLNQSEEAAIEDELSEEFAHSKFPNSATAVATTQSPQPSPSEETSTASVEIPLAYDGSLADSFRSLEQALKNSQYLEADKLTHDILLKLINTDQTWLNLPALRSFSPKDSDIAAIQTIDRLWSQTNPKFGFGRQLALYGRVADDGLAQDQVKRLDQALLFSQKADWWIEPLKFYKFYVQLDFTSAASDGHLPAKWFWQIPRSKGFELGNLGLLSERGGCRVDAFTLPEFMRMLRQCGIKSVE